MRSHFRYGKERAHGKSLWTHRNIKGIQEIVQSRSIYFLINTQHMLQHINDLSHHIELPWTLSKAEGIYYQLMSVADRLPDNVRVIIGLEPLNKTSLVSDIENGEASGHNVEVDGGSTVQRRNSTDSGNIKLGNDEVSFERGLHLSYM